MKFLLPLLVVISSCSPAKVYKEPEIGMDHPSFSRLCGWSVYDETGPTTTDANGSTTTYVLKGRAATFYEGGNAVDKERMHECVGAFKFVSGKLVTITR